MGIDQPISTFAQQIEETPCNAKVEKQKKTKYRRWRRRRWRQKTWKDWLENEWERSCPWDHFSIQLIYKFRLLANLIEINRWCFSFMATTSHSIKNIKKKKKKTTGNTVCLQPSPSRSIFVFLSCNLCVCFLLLCLIILKTFCLFPIPCKEF